MAVAVPGVAAPELAPLFQDHAVLQRDRPVPIWGRAGAGEHVSVAFAGQEVGATAGADGRWIVVLGPFSANPSGAELTVTGNGRAAVHDVVVGEVWLCAGAVGTPPVGDGVARRPPGATAAAASRFPLVRRFAVARKASAAAQEVATGEWEPCPPEPGPWASADIFFARDLFSRLDVPIGIVESSWPAAPVDAWMSPAALVAADAPSAAPGSSAEDPRAPASLFNGMIHPLLPCAIRGALWFEGEGDTGRPDGYSVRFPAMITAWRAHFGEGDFPFYWVQLGGRRPAAGAATGLRAAFREAQSRALSLPATGEAVSLDLGVAGTPRPGDSEEIGRRLALIAKARAYSISEDYSGPVFGGIEPDGPSLRVRFSAGGDGLTASGKPLQSFEVAGTDRVFHPAAALIEGDRIVVRSTAVRQPVAVRYAWSDSPEANLYNGAGLPAAPFRSDDW
jgi:sialate O-acetylesterase